MNRKVLSLILCLVMVFSLLPILGVPALAVDGVETTDGYAQAGDRTSWKMSDVTNWATNINTNAPYAEDGTLYVKVGDKYYNVVIAADPDYHGSIQDKQLGDDFLMNMAKSEGNYHWEQDNQEWCYVDPDGNMHQLYYNSRFYDNGVTNVYYIEPYYYANPLDQGVNTKGETDRSGTAFDTANNNFQDAVNSGRVILLTRNGTPDTSKTRWNFGYRVGDLTGLYNNPPSGKQNYLKISSFSHNANKKYSMFYEIDGTRYYMVRNTTSASNPSNTAWNDTLYYKVAENMIVDPETVPVQDSDRGEYSVTIENKNEITNPARANENGLKLSKELAYNEDSEAFDLTMESYSTVNVDKTNVTEKIPTDFVVVVDQSGSMAWKDMPVSYDKTIKQVDLETIAEAANAEVGSDNANGYYYKAEDGNYYRVYPVQDYLFHYYPANKLYVGDMTDRYKTNLGWFQSSSDDEADYANLMYFRDGEDADGHGHYQPITMTVRGAALTYYIKFRYTPYQGGTPVYFNREEESYIGGNSPWYHNIMGGGDIYPGWGAWPVNYDNVDSIVQGLWTGEDTQYTYSEFNIVLTTLKTGMKINYPMYERKVGYTKLVYRDVEGVEHIVPTSSGVEETEYCDENGNATTTKEATTRMWYNNLYTYHKATNTSRVSALQYALNQFLTAVANEKDTKNKTLSSVDNRVAIVGFADAGRSTTEVMTGESISAGGGVTKTTADNNVATYYGGALLSATDNGTIGAVNPKLTAAVNSITANGGTQPELGLNMAKQILSNRSIKDYTMVTGDQNTVKRNTIVIFFTDGRPGDYTYSNQYSEANEVVQEALNIKHLTKDGTANSEPLKTTIFSIGVFGEADGNPLTYNETNLVSPYNNRNFWPYMGGYVDTYQSGNSYYCLRRQWRAHNADYTPEANDTIYDYMSVVSSNYPDAENYIAPAWLSGNFNGSVPNVGEYVEATEGVRHSDSFVGSNQNYRMASNQDTLVKAFREAVTIAGSIVEGSSGVTTLDDMAKFEDKIDTENFDVSEATYSVWWQPIKVLDTAVPTVGYEGTTMIANNGDAVLKVDHQPVVDSGVIDYSGFDYSQNYVSKLKDEGYKLVVKVEGLKPLRYNIPMNSNADTGSGDNLVPACGIYPNGSSDARISIKSPVVTVFKAKSTYVADFNAPLIVATNATTLSEEQKGTSKDQINGNNGAFTLTGGNAVYQLNNGNLSDVKSTINSAYTTADSAWITGKHIEDGDGAPASEQEVAVIPGSSVYYSDALISPVTVGDGSGYNAAISSAAAQPMSDADGSRTLLYTFYGTGIDLYATTNTGGKYVTAGVYPEGYDGTDSTVKPEKPLTTMKTYSVTERYNVPVFSFQKLNLGTHVLRVVVSKNIDFQLAGIRVYNPTSETLLEEKASSEANAKFYSLRDYLLNDGVDVTVTKPDALSDDSTDLVAISGALYFDSVSDIVRESFDGEGNPILDDDGNIVLKSNYAAYKENGPKHEIYLKGEQGVAFQINKNLIGDNTKVWIGMSAPESLNGKGDAWISTSSQSGEVPITSSVDMYYPIDITSEDDGMVVVTNHGTSVISLTDIKITNAVAASEAETENIFQPVTLRMVKRAAVAMNLIEDDMEPEVEPSGEPTIEPSIEPSTEPTTDPSTEPTIDIPDEPTTEPTVVPTETPKPSGNSSVIQVISNFFNRLFGSIGRLFGR